MPIDSSSEYRQGLQHFLIGRHGQNATVVENAITIRVMPGIIEDTNFVSAEAAEFWLGGFQWSVLETGMYVAYTSKPKLTLFCPE